MIDNAVQETVERVELSWPGKYSTTYVYQETDGRWAIKTDRPREALRGFSDLSYYPEQSGEATALLLTGQRHDALSTLRRAMGPVFRFIYVDLPRLHVDDTAAAFQASSPLRLTTWLTMVRTLLLEARELLDRTGVVAVHCSEDEAHYAKLVLDELLRDKRVGTVVWQKAYSGRNMPGMKEFTDTHDLIHLYARDLEALPPVGLRRPPRGYTNLDADPRGPWKAEHKGAKTFRANSDFDTYQPPYRWRIVDGELPPGIWRLSPFTGVVWGIPSALGSYSFTAEAKDANGDVVVRSLSIDIADSGLPPEPPALPWLFEIYVAKGDLRIETVVLPVGVVGARYSAVLLAAGGSPFVGPSIRPGSGRYWDCARPTLLQAFQEDRVYQGSRQPTSIPTPKKFEPPAGEMEIENQQSIWPGRAKGDGAKEARTFAGYTEDATKHLKAMKELRLIETEIGTAKPERLMARLLEIFTDKGDLVLEAMSSTADLATVALKLDRRAVALQGASDRDRDIATSCALPRLKAVIAGYDQNLDRIGLGPETYIAFGGGGSLAVGEVGPELAVLSTGEDAPVLTETATAMSEDELVAAVLTAEGFLPPATGGRYAVALQGHERALVVPPSRFLTPELAAEVASDSQSRPNAPPTKIYYFKATDDIDEELFGGRVALRRVPFDLLGSGGA